MGILMKSMNISLNSNRKAHRGTEWWREEGLFSARRSQPQVGAREGLFYFQIGGGQ